jgi:cell division transport system permease protein
MTKSARFHALRKKLSPRLDIPFSRDDANRFLPWIIVLMVCLAGIFIAGGITVGEIFSHKKRDLSNWITIQLPADAADQAKEVTTLLSKTDGIAKIEVLENEETADMLTPWLGDQAQTSALPLPIVIQARLDADEPADTATLSEALTKISPTVDIDTHEYWVDHYVSMLSFLEGSAYFLALLIIAATTIMIVFTSKTALKLHEDAVWLLHSLGAADDYIAKQFQYNALLLGMRGALIGTAIAAAVFFLLNLVTAKFDAPLLPSLPITGWHVFVWLSLPLLTGLLAMFVARRTVLAMLRQIA